MDSSRIIKIQKIIEDGYDNIAGLVVINDDKRVFEHYFHGYTPKDRIHIASVTKSIMSGLVGIAVHTGAIQSIDQNVLDFFPEYKIKRGEKTIQKITIKNLLTMTAPFKYKYEPYTRVYSTNNWTEAVLDLLGGRGKAGEFKYTTIGLQVLSGLLVSATGRSLFEFANETLFSPLGINVEKSTRLQNRDEHMAFLTNKVNRGWVVDPAGVNTAGWGLCLTARDVARFGQLYLNNGKWKDRQIIPAEWIDESTREQSRYGELSYGYLWWIIENENLHCYAAIGDGGNILYISPEHNLTVVVLSSFKSRVRDRVELIQEHIAPLFI